MPYCSALDVRIEIKPYTAAATNSSVVTAASFFNWPHFPLLIQLRPGLP